MYVLLHPHFDQRVGAKLKKDRDLAQLVAHTSGGREVAGSSPVIPTKTKVKVLIFSTLIFLYSKTFEQFDKHLPDILYGRQFHTLAC